MRMNLTLTLTNAVVLTNYTPPVISLNFLSSKSRCLNPSFATIVLCYMANGLTIVRPSPEGWNTAFELGELST